MPSITNSLMVFPEVVTADGRWSEIIDSIRANSGLGLSFVLTNGLAGVVASDGLISNSAATAISSMLMATLLGVITAVTLAPLQREYRRAIGAAEPFITSFAAIHLTNSVMMSLLGFTKREPVS